MIVLRTFNASGVLGDDFVFASGDEANDQTEPDVAITTDNVTVVAWQGDNADASGTGIFVRRFSAAGASLGAPVLVNSVTAGPQLRPSAGSFTAGSALVCFDSPGMPWGAGIEHTGVDDLANVRSGVLDPLVQRVPR